jgi:hypothetical protein
MPSDVTNKESGSTAPTWHNTRRIVRDGPAGLPLLKTLECHRLVRWIVTFWSYGQVHHTQISPMPPACPVDRYVLEIGRLLASKAEHSAGQAHWYLHKFDQLNIA